MAHCGSHCCANCITTGSGRDLPSVARNSVSRGLAPALHNAATATTSDVRRRDAVAFVALRQEERAEGGKGRVRERHVIRRINVTRHPFETYATFPCVCVCVGERKLIALTILVIARLIYPLLTLVITYPLNPSADERDVRGDFKCQKWIFSSLKERVCIRNPLKI